MKRAAIPLVPLVLAAVPVAGSSQTAAEEAFMRHLTGQVARARLAAAEYPAPEQPLFGAGTPKRAKA